MSQRFVNKPEEEEDEEDLMEEEQPLVKKPEPVPDIASGKVFLVILLLFFVCGLSVIAWNSAHAHKQKGKNGVSAGGSLVQKSAEVIIDDAALEQLFNVLVTLESNCRPTIGSDVYNRLQIGTLADTNAAWQETKTLVKGTCDFYGLTAMENRTLGLEGPAELCHAGFTIVLEIVAVRLKYVLPPDIYAIAIEVIDTAYPLSLYWKTSPYTKYDIAGIAVAQIQAFVTSSDKRPHVYATAFCNQYFASDQPDYYTSLFMPWLAFPFEGLLQRQSNTLIPVALDTLLSRVQRTYNDNVFKAVYSIGNAYDLNPGIQLFVDSVMDGIEVIQLGDMSVGDALHYIQGSITIGGNTGVSSATTTLNTSAIPILVIGRYADNIGAYNGFKVEQSSIIFMFTDDDPDGVLERTGSNMSLPTYIQAFTTSARVMGVFDFSTDHPYEAALGEPYVSEKDVADILTGIIGTGVTTSWQKTGSLLDTFALKNVVVNSADIGGRLRREQLLEQLAAQGIVLGMKPDSYKTDLEGAIVEDIDQTVDNELFGTSTLVAGSTYIQPSSLNLKTLYPQCFVPIEDQKNCQGCWCMSAANAMTAQLCTLYGVPISQGFSQQHIIGCANVENSNGCLPQGPGTAFSMMYGDIHTRMCMPLINTGTKDLGCPTSCKSGSLVDLAVVNGIKSGSYTKLSSPSVIKKFMDQNKSPVAAALTITEDFLDFYASNPSGVFNPIAYSGNFIGYHMIECHGWDDTAPIPYWECDNSWSTSFANQGVFRFAQNIKGYVNSTIWLETNSYVALVRPGSINPVTTVELIPGNASSTVATKPSVYTTPHSCPKILVNPTQDDQAATINGCASNNARKTSSAQKKTHEKGLVSKSAASSLSIMPYWLLIMAALAALMW